MYRVQHNEALHGVGRVEGSDALPGWNGWISRLRVRNTIPALLHAWDLTVDDLLNGTSICCIEVGFPEMLV